MKTLLAACLLIGAFFPKSASAGTDKAEFTKELVSRIKAYEVLFDHVYLKAGIPALTTGTDGLTKVGPIQIDYEFFSDGGQFRCERSRVQGLSGRTYTTWLRVGDQTKEWTRSPKDPAGRGWVNRHHAVGIDLFLGTFRRHIGLDLAELPDIDVVANSESHVTLRFRRTPNRKLLATYERYGEYLRTVTYEPSWVDSKSGEWVTGTCYYFEYAPWKSPSRDGLAPVAVVWKSGVHNTRTRLEFTHVNFDYKVSTDTFVFFFPEKCRIQDVPDSR